MINIESFVMNKFVLKYFIIFLSVISLLFFSLISFQKYTMDKEHENYLRMQEMAALNKNQFQMPPPPVDKSPSVLIPFLFIIIISSVLIYFVLVYIDKNFVVPLLLIEKNTDKIKEGLLNVEFKTNSDNHEVQEAFDTMNKMVQGLKQREKLHDNFIRNLVHDLRAPVIAQERAMEILSDELKNNELVEGMVKNNDAYLKMINVVIECFSNQDIKIEKMDFDFSQLAENVLTALRPAANAKNIELRTSIQNNLTVWADYISFNRIITNLLSNAIENIDNNKTVTIQANKNPESTVIVIQDNGSGMNDEEKEMLFKQNIKFSDMNKKSVSGLGLSIVYDLVAQNGGQIRVESEKNEYTKFIIELPNKE